MPSYPQSLKKTRARRVFGEIIVESLNKDRDANVSNVEDGCNLNKVDVGNSLSYSTGISEPSTSMEQTDTFSPSKRLCFTTPSGNMDSQCGASEKMLTNAMDKENRNDVNVSSELLPITKSPCVTKRTDAPPAVIHFNSNDEIDDTAIGENRNKTKQDPPKNPMNDSRKQNCINGISNSRSKRRDLVKITQKAITQATASVNDTLNAARVARDINAQDRAREINRFRDEWKEETEEARKFQEEAERIRRGLLNLQSQLSSKFQQSRVRTREAQHTVRFNEIAKRSQFESKVYRDQHRTLKEERDRRRRESNMARAKLRLNCRQGEEKLRLIRQNEHLALMKERNESYNASSKFKIDNATKRRKSYAFRNGDARRIREIYSGMKIKEAECEQDSYQLKFKGERDADAYRKKLKEERRKSMAFRSKEARDQRIRLCKERKLLQKQEKESISLKLAAERDVDKYHKNMNEARRKSLAKRNLDAKKKRDNIFEAEKKTIEDEHKSYKLKWAGEKDTEAYKRKVAKDRRDSLAFRNKESFQHSKVMEELRILEKEREAESYILKWAGERDAKKYEEQLREERRKSLKGRNEEKKRLRDMQQEQRSEELALLAQDETMRAVDHKEMENYKKQLAARDRASLAYRRKEANLVRIEGKLKKQKDYQIEQGNRALVDAANWDVAGYIEDCKTRKRMSLVVRAKEKRHHREWQQKQAEQAYKRRREDARLRARDRRYQDMALREERRQIALEAIRHAGCSFNVNAFSLLN
mmetsp:Transcript_34332/g.39108  ORF Transcript_34332/g.39108 Transcript_34332/m.39108 type:complete len:760 (-) Transcript_34332:60-2339(-)